MGTGLPHLQEQLMCSGRDLQQDSLGGGGGCGCGSVEEGGTCELTCGTAGRRRRRQ